MAHLVTGYAGEEHITSADQGSFNASFFGTGQFVMEAGRQFEASIIDNNTVRVFDGDMLMQGRHIRIPPDTYEDMVITTGTAGKNRIDIICMTYEKNSFSGTEKAYLEVVRGEETEGTAQQPEYISGNILEGTNRNQMPLYRVTIQGVVLSGIECLFGTITTYQALAEKYEAEFMETCRNFLGALTVFDTMKGIRENTEAKQLAGALALKELDSNLNSHAGNKSNPHGVSREQLEVEKTDNTSDMDKPVSTAQQAALDALYEQLTAYTRQKIADLINGAPSNLDTLKEVSDAISAHKTIMDALDAAIGKKANAAEFDSHTKDTTKHITAAERTSWNGKLAPTGDASNVIATFSQATTRANLASKEKLSVSLGKIMKWLADLANGAASTLLGTNLTANRVVIANGSGKVATSSVTSTELGYLAGAKSKVQDQIDELNTHIQVLGEHVYLAASNKKDWVWVNVPDLNAFRYILLCRTTLNGSSRGCNITTLNLFRSLNNSSLTFSVDDTDTTLACYSSDTKVGLYSSRDDRQTMLFGIR